jgi:hypothetical protein
MMAEAPALSTSLLPLPCRTSPSKPSARPLTFPATHRQILVWLFQDLVQWVIATDQVSMFRPRRN